MSSLSAKMFSAIVCLLSLASAASAAAIHPQTDGFSLEDINGVQHFAYGVVPSTPGQNVRLEFYGVDFVSDNCQDMRVDIYRNGYVHTPMDLLQTICDPSTLADFNADSARGFYIAMVSSDKVHRAQFKARFICPGGVKTTHEILHR